MTTTHERVHPELEAQRHYIHEFGDREEIFALVAAEAFVRGIRDIGYKSTATALDELVDNAIEAGSTKISIVFGYGTNSDNKPDRLAIIDNGHGMDPIMVRAAMMWGGTHRENRRSGFGRYGYGLPSSCVSQGKSFTVYSLPEGGTLHKVTLDLDDLTSGEYYDESVGRVVIPNPVPSELPTWIEEHRRSQFGTPTIVTGTVVAIEKIDRLSWTTTAALERNLLEHIGVTHRNFLNNVSIFVNSKRVEPVDPLFITEGCRLYDIDADRAEPLEPGSFTVRDRENRQEIGTVALRYSYLPPRFGSKDKAREAVRSNQNGRFSIMADHNGIIILREGRQIDVVTTKCPWTRFQNNDRFWNVEVDFPATLDEEFSITTSKQQVVLSDRIWDLLKQQGVERAIDQMRKRYRENKDAFDKSDETDEQRKRASEQVMRDAEKFKTRNPVGDVAERQKEAGDRFNDSVERTARDQNRSPELVRQELIAEAQGNPYKVKFESLPGGPHYRPEQVGSQFVLWINMAHRFYTDVYFGPESTPRLRAGLELMLFVLGEAELDASDEDRRLFYLSERQAVWAQRLGVVLDILGRHSNVDDINAMQQEIAETEPVNQDSVHEQT